MKKYALIKKKFYKDKKDPFQKVFLLEAVDNIMLKSEQNISSGVFFKLTLKKKQLDLYLKIELYSWSNDKQDYQPLQNSIWREDQFGSGKNIATIKKHYEPIVNKFLKTFHKNINHLRDIKEFIYRLENPTFIFHHKLLNLFSQKELEDILLTHFENYPIFNIPLYKSTTNISSLSYTLLPHIVNGFYIDGIEISTDLNDNDIAVIEDCDSGKITKKQFFKQLQKKS